MKTKVGGSAIIWIFALIMAVVYFTLPSSSEVAGVRKQEKTVEENQREYTLYFPKGNDFQTKTAFMEENLEGLEMLRTAVQENADLLSEMQLEKEKVELLNLYQDGNIIYLSFNVAISSSSQAAIQKTIATLGIEQEVRILGNGE